MTLPPNDGDAAYKKTVRMMRPLSQLGIVAETDEETYAATGVTHALKDPILLGGYTFMYAALVSLQLSEAHMLLKVQCGNTFARSHALIPARASIQKRRGQPRAISVRS